MKPYACHDRLPFRDTVIVQDGWTGPITDTQHTRHSRMVAIPFRMARECSYATTALGAADRRCDGCQHGQRSTSSSSPEPVTV